MSFLQEPPILANSNQLQLLFEKDCLARKIPEKGKLCGPSKCTPLYKQL